MQTCDLCHRPATSFYCYATCNVGGGQAEPPKKSLALCAEHAALHANEECEQSLGALLRGLQVSGQLATPVEGIHVIFTARDEKAAQSFGRAILRLCGGELSILSPEAMDERLRRVAGQLYGMNAPEIPKTNRWEIEWTSDAAISVLDQWQTGGWSRRLYDLIVAHGCELNGWEIGPKRK